MLESLIRTMTPDEGARTAAAKHHKEIEDWLTSDLGIIRMRETGSWHHGTALDKFSDVDYFVSMRGNRPSVSFAALETLRSSLSRGIKGSLARDGHPKHGGAHRAHHHEPDGVTPSPRAPLLRAGTRR